MIPKWIFISINPRKWSLELGPSCNHNLRSVKNLEHRRVDLEISSNETVTATKQTQLRLFKAPTRWRCRRPIRTCTEWRVQLTKRSNQYSIHLHLWHYNGNLWKSHKCWSCPSPPPKKKSSPDGPSAPWWDMMWRLWRIWPCPRFHISDCVQWWS